MYILHIINRLAFFTTLGLYITVFLGMFSQMILGPLQLIIAIAITLLYYKQITENLKNFIIYYWLLVAIALVLAYLGWITYHDFPYWITIPMLFVIPMLVASYFVYVTYRINKFINPKEE